MNENILFCNMFYIELLYIFSINLMPPPQLRVKRLFEAIGVASCVESGQNSKSKK